MILGAGQVGSHLARILIDRGHDVRIVRQSPARSPDGATLVQGDAGDPAFCVSAAEGTTTVYHCLNPFYSTTLWARLVQR